ncbi:MAG: phospho-N-acetylmuramoyl-pentapeptide-transferase [Planctomycetota bacterium]
MLADLLDSLLGTTLFEYISVRVALAAFTAFAVALLIGGRTIRWLKSLRVDDNVETSGSADLADTSKKSGKDRTPSMGGSFLIASLLFAVLAWADVTRPLVMFGVILCAGLGAVGFLDDYTKLTRPKSGGMSRRAKWIGLSLVCLFVILAAVQNARQTGRGAITSLYPPFFKDVVISPLEWAGIWGALGFVAFVFFEWLVLVGTANAANITDGLDGLAAGCVLISGLALTIFCYVTGRADWTGYLDLPYVPAASDMAVFGGALCGACMGFLWFNAHPAKVFMGDSGSLPLGGVLAWMAFVSKQELVLPLIACVLVIDAGSSWLQTFYFRRTGGKRIFTMAPIHHGLQLYGGVFTKRPDARWHEVTVVIRFWIVAAVGAIASLALLKIR